MVVSWWIVAFLRCGSNTVFYMCNDVHRATVSFPIRKMAIMLLETLKYTLWG